MKLNTERCKLCMANPPCPKGKCCMRCAVAECDVRQCESKAAKRVKRTMDLLWYLRDKVKVQKV